MTTTRIESIESSPDIYDSSPRSVVRPSIRFVEGDTYQGEDTDPISLHKYLYANGNPIMNDDPTGMFAETLATLEIINVLAAIPTFNIAAATQPTTRAVLAQRPADLASRQVVAAVFGESTTGANASEDEKLAIIATIWNQAFYALQKPPKSTKGYNGSFGDGTIFGAITKNILAYKGNRWNLVAANDDLKPDVELQKMKPADIQHYNDCVAAVTAAGAFTQQPGFQGPIPITALGNRAPVGFNQAKNSPPSSREERLGKLGAHTFYGFVTGRELE